MILFHSKLFIIYFNIIYSVDIDLNTNLKNISSNEAATRNFYTNIIIYFIVYYIGYIRWENFFCIIYFIEKNIK